MGFSFEEIGIAFMVLFAVIDIIGSIPIILKVKQSAGEINPLRATLVSLILMIVFLFAGEWVLNLFGVDIRAFAVAGSFILFALSIEMIMGVTLFKEDKSSSKIASIVPIAFPIIAGAGTMTTLLSLRAEYEMINIVIAVFLNIVIVFFTLKLTKRIERLLGPGGIAILKKAFGIILLAIAVKLFAENASALFSMDN